MACARDRAVPIPPSQYGRGLYCRQTAPARKPYWVDGPVGFMDEITHKGGCHCGEIRFEFTAPPIMDVTDCNCSICNMSAYEHIFVPQENLTFLSGEDQLATYTFNSGAAKHKFCKICGVKPLYIPRSHPDCWSVNYRCIDPGTLKIGRRIPFDGRNWEKNIKALKDET